MLNNESGNDPTTRNTDSHGADRRDWREERREWRRERREARHHYPYHGLFAGLLLILLGGMFLANLQGWISGDTWWQWLLIGIGSISIISGIVQYHAPERRYWGYGKFVWGTALIALGAMFLLGVSQWWPVILIGVGIALLLRFLWRR